MTVYNYTKTPVFIDTLNSEIIDANFLSATYEYINYNDDSLDIYFDGELSPTDESFLNDIISSHTGQEVYESSGKVFVSNGSGGGEYVNLNTISGLPTSLTDLSDTPDNIIPGKYLRTTSSGYSYGDLYVRNIVYMSAQFTGDYRDGSITHPFNNAYETIVHVNSNYLDPDTDSLLILMLPGIYYYPYQVPITNPSLRGIIGTDYNSVILRPTEVVVGSSFIQLYTPIVTRDLTFDGSYIPEFATTSGSVAINILDDSGEDLNYYDCKFIGFNEAFRCDNGSNVNIKGVIFEDCPKTINISNGSYMQIDDSIIINSNEYCIKAASAATVDLRNSVLRGNTTYSGTALLSTGSDSKINISNTYIQNCYKNIYVSNSASVIVNNSIISNSINSLGIEQLNTGVLTILNSSVYLSDESISLEDSDYCYINTFDSENNHTTIGNGSQINQILFSVFTGQSDNPALRYDYAHNNNYRAMYFHNPIEGENSELYVSNNNGNAAIGVHPSGDNAYNKEATVGLVSIQEGTRSGWNLTKEAGEEPNFKLTNKAGKNPLTVDYDGNITLTSGVSINKILDEDDFVSNSSNAVATQQSTKSFVENYSYSTSEVDAWRDQHPFTASGIDYTNTVWQSTDVKDVLDKITKYNSEVIGSGIIEPEVTISGVGETTLYINSGRGYINYNNLHKEVSWTYDEVDVSLYTPGIYYVYIDYNGNINTSLVAPDNDQVINIGLFAYNGYYILVAESSGRFIGNYYNRVLDFIKNLGIFITDNGGLIQAISNYPQKITSSACTVQYGSSVLTLPEINSNPPGLTFNCVYRASDIGWAGDPYFLSPLGYYGNIPTDRWNDTSASGYYPLQDIYTFTQYSNIVTVSGNAADLNVGDYIWLNNETYTYATPVTSISGTIITLNSIYYGSSGSGLTIANKAMPLVPEGKWLKHIVVRDLKGGMYVTLSQQYYDDEDSATAAPIPEIDPSFQTSSVKMAYVTCSGYQTDLSGSLIDIRPLPFHYREGGSQSGGLASDHGNLQGLLDDDHTQYSLVNGSRDFIGKVSYSSHPTFSSDTELVDKKFVEDSISSLTTDHGELSGLSDDDHPQYLNISRGDERYYTQDQINTISGNLAALIPETSDQASLEVERDTQFLLTTSFQDVPFNNTIFENNIDVLQHDDSNTERININESGTYFIHYNLVAEVSISTTITYARLYKNGVDLVSSSALSINTYTAEKHALSNTVIVTLTEGDYITLRLAKSSSGGNVSITNSRIIIFKQSGYKGDTGPQGAPGLVTISGSSYFDAYDSSGNMEITTSWKDVEFDTIRYSSGGYTFNSNKELVIPFTGVYQLNTRVTTDISSGLSGSESAIRVIKDTGSGYYVVPGAMAYVYNRREERGEGTPCINFIDELTVGDKLKVQVIKVSGDDTMITTASGTTLSVHIPGGLPGVDGQDGQDGAPGSGSTVIIKDEGINLNNTPHSALNFTGSGVTASDAGSGVTTINIPGNTGIVLEDEGSTVAGGPFTTLNFTGSGVTASDAGGNEATINIPTPTSTFGSYFFYGGEEATTSVSSDTPIQKARLTTSSIPEGTYRIGWYYEWYRSTASSDFRSRIQINDTTTIMEQSEESADSNSWHTNSGFYIASLSSGVYNIDFDYWGEYSSYTNSVRRLRLEFWRIS